MSADIWILLLVFVALLLVQAPVAVAIGLATLATLLAQPDIPSAFVVAQRMSAGIASFPLLAIPFFVLAGVLLGEGGMARRLTVFAQALVGRFPGGLAYVNTLSCMLFGAVSGSATAAVSSIGGFLIPEMERNGYKREFAVALTATSATTGLLIPPSNIMVVYAVAAGGVSVGALFLAGVVPGILVGLALMAASFLVHLRQGGHGAEVVRLPARAVLAAFAGAVPSLFLLVLVLGGILGGIFSATEASAIAVAYAGFLAMAVYREVRPRDLPRILLLSAKTTSVVMFLVGTSQALSWLLAYEGIPQAAGEALLKLAHEPLMLLLLINVLLLVVGTFMDMTPAVLIFTPIFLPVAVELGIDPVHFGVVMVANLCVGLCTPPVGTCLFVGCSVGRASIARVTVAMLPFFAAMLLALALITAFPALSMALPNLLDR